MNRKIISLYLRLSFLTAMAPAFFFATYQLFLKGLGLNLLEINLVNAFFGLGVMFFEIPTGAVADIWGRKTSVIIGCLLTGLSFLAYFLATSFWQCVGAELIGALGCTFISGAADAWLVDSLNFCGCRLRLEKIFSQGQKTKTIGVIIGVLGGSLLGTLNLSYPWILSALMMFITSGYLFYKLPEIYFIKPEKANAWKQIITIGRDSFYESVKNREILGMMILSFVLGCAIPATNMYWPIVYKDMGQIEVWGLGLFFLLILGSLRLGTALASKFQKRFKSELTPIILSQVGISIGFILASIFGLPWLSLIGFLGHELFRGSFDLLRQGYLNRRLKQAKRATMLSANSMVSSIGLTLGLMVSGLIAREYSISLSWLVSGIFILTALGLFLLIRKK
ncbi:MAG: MFS transporter [Candidatus Falkowbacteria bacterium]